MKINEITQTVQLLEMPEIVAPTDWNLSDPKVNSIYAEYFRRYPVEIFKDYSTGQLLIQDGNIGGQIGFLSKITHLLEYYVHYEKSHQSLLGDCATQIKLWRSRYASVKNLADIGFSQILLVRFDTIISDTQQTERGKEFWEIQMSAFSHNKAVGFLDNGRMTVYDSSIPIEDWIKQTDGWKRSKSFRRKRYFISNLKI